MEKNIKINIAGQIFQIEDKAFEVLRDYLQQINVRLKNHAGGNEMIEDIEARIAEIFQDCPSWKTGLISIEDVNEMIEKMGSPDEIAGDLEESEKVSLSFSTDLINTLDRIRKIAGIVYYDCE